MPGSFRMLLRPEMNNNKHLTFYADVSFYLLITDVQSREGDQAWIPVELQFTKTKQKQFFALIIRDILYKLCLLSYPQDTSFLSGQYLLG